MTRGQLGVVAKRAKEARRLKMQTAVLVIAMLLSLSAPHGALGDEHLLVLVDPAAPLEEAWTHRKFGAATEYRRVEVDGTPYIRAVGRNSASGLHGEVKFRPDEYPWLEWTWRVDKLQKTADIRTKAGEDMAAAIYLFFGRPSWFRPEVPTLSYVWTNDKLPKEAVVLSPYHPGTVREIVIESGAENLGQWVSVRRNIVEDYLTAFGKEPPGPIEMIALWSDNDQTGEPVEAYYGAVHALKE